MLSVSANAGIAMAQTIATTSSAASSFLIAFFMVEKVSFQFKYPKGFYSGLALRRRWFDFAAAMEGAAF